MDPRLINAIVAPDETSRFIRITSFVGKVSAAITLVTWVIILQIKNAINELPGLIMGISFIVLAVCACILGLRYISKTSNKSLAQVIGKWALLFVVLPVTAAAIIFLVAYLLHAPIFYPKG